MKKINRILTVIDPTSDAQPALQRAAWVAEKTGAELELFICYYNEYLSGDRLFDSPSLEKARDDLSSETYALVSKCLRRESWQRFPSLATLYDLLQVL